jgi:hypothetical protein
VPLIGRKEVGRRRETLKDASGGLETLFFFFFLWNNKRMWEGAK